MSKPSFLTLTSESGKPFTLQTDLIVKMSDHVKGAVTLTAVTIAGGYEVYCTEDQQRIKDELQQLGHPVGPS